MTPSGAALLAVLRENNVKPAVVDVVDAFLPKVEAEVREAIKARVLDLPSNYDQISRQQVLAVLNGGGRVR